MAQEPQFDESDPAHEVMFELSRQFDQEIMPAPDKRNTAPDVLSSVGIAFGGLGLKMSGEVMQNVPNSANAMNAMTHMLGSLLETSGTIRVIAGAGGVALCGFLGAYRHVRGK